MKRTLFSIVEEVRDGRRFLFADVQDRFGMGDLVRAFSEIEVFADQDLERTFHEALRRAACAVSAAEDLFAAARRSELVFEVLERPDPDAPPGRT